MFYFLNLNLTPCTSTKSIDWPNLKLYNYIRTFTAESSFFVCTTPTKWCASPQCCRLVSLRCLLQQLMLSSVRDELRICLRGGTSMEETQIPNSSSPAGIVVSFIITERSHNLASDQQPQRLKPLW